MILREQPAALVLLLGLTHGVVGCGPTPTSSERDTAAATNGSSTDELSAGDADDSPLRDLASRLQERGIQIMNGEPAPDASHVVFVALDVDGRVGLCTGALVTPDLVLTAAHCVSNTEQTVRCDESTLGDPWSPSDLRVTTAADLRGSPGPDLVFHPTEAVHLFAEPGALLCGNDLALLELSEPIPSSEATPLEVAREPARPGDRVLAYGYGSNSTEGGGELLRRVSSELTILCVGTDCGELELDGANGPLPHVQANEFVTEAAPCPGDSGGPAMRDGHVLGILSRGSGDCVAPIFGQKLRALIDFVRTRAERESLPVPSWAAPLPDPEPETPPAGSPDPEPGAAGTGNLGGGSGGDDGRKESGGCSFSPSLVMAGPLPWLFTILTLLAGRGLLVRRTRREPAG